MKLSIGIVGLPNVGKSTLFKILTKQNVNVANYPFATIEPNIGIVPVPDKRLKQIAEISRSKEIIPAVIEFYDIAGLVRGAHQGEGLGNQFLSHIKETQAIVIVLRLFSDPNIIHIEKNIDPLRDLEIINQELIFKDLETISRKIYKLEKEVRVGDKNLLEDLGILKEISKILDNGKLIFEWADKKVVKELNLLTAKKQIYLLNGHKEDVFDELIFKINEMGASYVIYDLITAEEVPDLILKAYEILNLITFFTTGEKETRAWSILKGTKALQVASIIHSDFGKKFIRMEVINFKDFILAGGWNEARQKGLIKIEGKDYILKDGDIILIKHGA